MDLRDQVGAGDIDKTAGGQGQKYMGKPPYLMGEKIPQDRPAKGAQAGKKVIKQCLFSAEAPVDQDPEVTQLLGDLVDNHQQCGEQPQFNRNRETPGNHQAVNKIMQAIAKKIQIGKGMVVADPIVAVAPVKVFLQEKE